MRRHRLSQLGAAGGGPGQCTQTDGVRDAVRRPGEGELGAANSPPTRGHAVANEPPVDEETGKPVALYSFEAHPRDETV